MRKVRWFFGLAAFFFLSGIALAIPVLLVAELWFKVISFLVILIVLLAILAIQIADALDEAESTYKRARSSLDQKSRNIQELTSALVTAQANQTLYRQLVSLLQQLAAGRPIDELAVARNFADESELLATIRVLLDHAEAAKEGSELKRGIVAALTQLAKSQAKLSGGKTNFEWLLNYLPKDVADAVTKIEERLYPDATPPS